MYEAAQNHKASKDERCHEAWRKILRAENGVALYRGLAHLQELFAITIAAVSSREADTESASRILPRLERLRQKTIALPAMNATWSALRRDEIEDTAIFALSGACDVAGDLPELKTTEEAITNLRMEFEDLGSRVQESDLPEDLKRQLLAPLAAAISALKAAHVTGVAPVRDAVAQSLGELVLVVSEHPDLATRDDNLIRDMVETVKKAGRWCGPLGRLALKAAAEGGGAVLVAKMLGG